MKNTRSQNMGLFFTKHARTRMQQRSFSKTDVEAILDCGTYINDNEILFRRKDTEREVSRLCNRLKTVERRIGKQRINRCGTEMCEVSNDLFSERDSLREQINTVERLKNRKVVLSGNHVVTCYPCSKSELKRISKTIN